MVAFFGLRHAMIISVAGYVISSAWAALIRVREEKRGATGSIVLGNPFANLVSEVKEGFRLMVESGIVAFLVWRLILLMGFVGMVVIELVSFSGGALTGHGHAMPGILALGYILMSVGVGVILGPLLFGILAKRVDKVKAIRWGFVALGCATCALAFTKQFAVVLLLVPFMGMAFALIVVLAETMLQTSVPDRLLGRIFGVMNTLRQVVFAGMAIIAGVADRFVSHLVPSQWLFSWEQLVFLVIGSALAVYGAFTIKGSVATR